MTMSQHETPPTWEFVSKVERHRCALPRRQHEHATFVVGDEIRCVDPACRKQYRLKEIDGGMQWDPINPPALLWKEVD